MDSWLIIATIMMLFFLISIWMAAAKWAAKQWYLLSLLTMIGAVITYGVLQSPRPETKPENAMFRSMTAEDLMAQLQVQLKENPNDAGLWFQLGQGYLLNKELDAALICFDYAIQLTEHPSSTQLAAKATALYYLGSQQMSGEVSLCLSKPYNLNLTMKPPYRCSRMIILSLFVFSKRLIRGPICWILMILNWTENRLSAPFIKPRH